MAEESLRFCKTWRCVVLPGVSHWIQYDEPSRAAAELIAQLWRRHRGAPMFDEPGSSDAAVYRSLRREL